MVEKNTLRRNKTIAICGLFLIIVMVGFGIIFRENKEKNKLVDEFPLLEEIKYEDRMYPAMEATSSDLLGFAGGYLFAPKGDEVYRYNSFSTETEGLTRKELILETVEELEFEDDIPWEIYSLEEYPEQDVILATCPIFGDTLFQYVPSINKEEADVADAVENGFVVIQNGALSSGEDLWEAFYQRAKDGKEAHLRMGYCYTDEGVNMSEELREATKDDSLFFFLKEIRYDGEKYTVSPVNKVDGNYVICEIPGIDSPQAEYQYLMCYEGDNYGRYSHYEKYVLVNDNTVTWEDIQSSFLMPELYEYIPNEELFGVYEE